MAKGQQLIHQLHRRFIYLLCAAYGVAAIVPSPGLWMKSLDWSRIPGLGGSITTSLLMLAILLFNAGLSVDQGHFKALKQKPMLTLTGVLGKALLALIWLAGLALALAFSAPTLMVAMLAGFAMVSLMPVATSSTAWAQQSNANLALSLGLLLISTLLAPVIVPILGWLTQQLPPALSVDPLNNPASSFDTRFIVMWIFGPILMGLWTQWYLSQQTMLKLRPWIRVINALNLLLLNYMHGASFLPQCLNPFRPGILTVLLLGVAVCCFAGFAFGGLLGRLTQAQAPERLALMFGTGMNNNGMALVLASYFLGEAGWIGLTIALCTLGQHLVAGLAQHLYAYPQTVAQTGSADMLPSATVSEDQAFQKTQTSHTKHAHSKLMAGETKSRPRTP